MKLGERIQSLRNEKGLSALDLSKRLNRSESAIRMWESGNSKPDVDTLTALAIIFDCTTDYLLGKTEFKNKKEAEKYFSSETTLFSLLGDMPTEQKKKLIYRVTSFISSMEYLNLNDKSKSTEDNKIFDEMINIIGILAGVLAVTGACLKEIEGIEDSETVNNCIFLRLRQLEKGKRDGFNSFENIYRILSKTLISSIPEDSFRNKLNRLSNIRMFNDLDFKEGE